MWLRFARESLQKGCFSPGRARFKIGAKTRCAANTYKSRFLSYIFDIEAFTAVLLVTDKNYYGGKS